MLRWSKVTAEKEDWLDKMVLYEAYKKSYHYTRAQHHRNTTHHIIKRNCKTTIISQPYQKHTPNSTPLIPQLYSAWYPNTNLNQYTRKQFYCNHFNPNYCNTIANLYHSNALQKISIEITKHSTQLIHPLDNQYTPVYHHKSTLY